MTSTCAVIFDLDGTLTDTEKYYQKAWPMAIEHFGFKCQLWMPLELRSLGRPFAPLRFREWFGESFNYDEVRAYRKKVVKEMISKGGIPLKPFAVETLKLLRENGITVAMATANDFERTRGYLTELGIFELFDRIICADMVKQGKPAPDIYSYACEALGLEPDQCYAVEDSPNGVKSAYAAGCRVIMVPDLTEPDDEIRPMLYARAEDLHEVFEIVKRSIQD